MKNNTGTVVVEVTGDGQKTPTPIYIPNEFLG